MSYDFDRIIDRKGTWSLKWDTREGELPMWVADMDFETAPEVKEAILERAANGAFGYSITDGQWEEAYISWWGRRHGFKFTKEELIFSTGVVPSISSLVRKLCTPNEKVLILTPVYNIFYNSILNNGMRPQESRLKLEDGVYSIDWEDLEEKMSDPQVSLMVFCNPHNPVGRIWTKEELQKVGEMAGSHGITVISDEIHCDITAVGKEYIPFATASKTNREISITLIAPTKTFNIAGINTSAMVVSNPVLRHKAWRAINTDECGEPGAFAMPATIAAFTKGETWLEKLRAYLDGNRSYAEEYIKANIPELSPIHGEATYLLWVDARTIDTDDKLSEVIREKTGLWVTEGEEYGESGRGFLRINLACPRSMVMDGMERLKKGVEEYISLRIASGAQD